MASSEASAPDVSGLSGAARKATSSPPFLSAPTGMTPVCGGDRLVALRKQSISSQGIGMLVHLPLAPADQWTNIQASANT